MTVTSLQQAKELALRHVDQGYVVGVLRSLVGAASENPPGKEMNMAVRLREVMSGLGIEVEFVEVLPRRPSVVAVIKGTAGSPTLVLNGHIDTVPIGDMNDWTANPFGGEEREGRLYGRGAADMKAGVTAMIAAVKALRDAHIPLKGNIILQFAMGEEMGEAGTKLLVDKGYVGEYGIVTEPTGLKVATAERGLAWFKVTTFGRASHAGTPHLGLNAIELASRAVDILVRYNNALQHRAHPLLGSPKCTVTMIQGGIKENVVADRCEMVIDRRMLPGEVVEEVETEIRDVLNALLSQYPGARYNVELMRVYEAAEIPVDAPLAQVVNDNLSSILGRTSPPWGTPYSSDVRNLVNDGHMQALTFGPGLIDDAHRVDESVEIQQVVDAAKVIAGTAIDLLGVEGLTS